jgi:general secretion pathway protein L
MSESLIIHLRNGAEPEWLVCNDDGSVVERAAAGPLEQATAMAAGRRIIAVVPATDALVTESDAPAKSASKLAQVIPFALEERVADEIEDLHFAIGTRHPGTQRVPVVVAARAKMEGWLGALAAAGLTPQAIYSEAALLPSMPGQLIALLNEDTLIMRVAESMPLVLPALSLPDAFEMALATLPPPAEGLEPAPLGLLLYSGHAEWEAHQHSVDALRERFTGVKVQLLPSGPLSVLAPAAASGDAVNLLQGAFTPVSPAKRGWQAWRLAAILAGVLFALHVGGRFFELSTLKRREADLDARIEQEFRRAMPGQQNAMNARRRVQQRLLELQGGGGSSTLLPALSAFAAARTAAPQAQIDGMNYNKDGSLELRITAPDAATLDVIGQQLRAANWQADVLGGSASGLGYRGRMKVSRG